jgi:hypothetical protein
MEGSGRSRAGLSLAALVALVAISYGCGRDEQPVSRAQPLTIGVEPIPAPPFAFGDSATPAQYLAYASSLVFAVEDSTSAITRYGPPGAVSVVRMSPEVRLVGTDSTAYATGRIIARIQTDSAGSPYGTPIGEAFLWVWQAPAGISARIITREPGLDAGGRVLTVPSFYHFPLPDSVRKETFCIRVETLIDTLPPGNCCRCGGGCWNPWAMVTPMDSAMVRVRRALGV